MIPACRATAVIAALVFVIQAGCGVAAAQLCLGDFNGDKYVRVPELVEMVNNALKGCASAPRCNGDANGNGSVTVDELVRAVNHALSDCPVFDVESIPSIPAPSADDEQLIASAGGQLTLFNTATLTVPGGAFATDTLVNLSASDDEADAYDFSTSTTFERPVSRLYEVRVTSARRPAASLDLEINLPAELGVDRLEQLQAYIRLRGDAGLEILEHFERIDSTIDPLLRTVSVTLSTFSFLELTADSFEATIIIAVLDEESLGSASGAGDCPITMVPPLNGNLEMRIVRGFDDVGGHYGVDYDTADTGDMVSAAAAGTVELVTVERCTQTHVDKKKSGCTSVGTEKGWGQYVVIRHMGGSGTLYAHLKRGSVVVKQNDPVSPGQVIAEADNSGHSTGSHLHFELFGSGDQFDKKQKRNGQMCIDSSTPTPTATMDRTPTPTPSAAPCDTSGTGAGIVVCSSGGTRGGTAEIEVKLRTGGRSIAGTQNELTLGTGIALQSCAMNPSIQKEETRFRLLPDGCSPGATCRGVRSIVVSTLNTLPIPNNSTLYRCAVKIAANAPVGNSAIQCGGVGASDPEGAPVSISCGGTFSVR